MSPKLHSVRLASLLSAVCAAGLLAGCVTPPTPATAHDAEVMAKLAAYSERASNSMARLAAIRSASAGVTVAPGVVPAGLEVPVSVSWSGPVDQLVQQIADVAGYEYGGTLGSIKTPVLVSMAVTSHTAFNVLSDAAAQAGSAADIVVHPDTKKIFVKYPPAMRSGGYPVQPR